jgi:GT2 family glycosyltransferase
VPRVSIIIPTYNCARFIKQALNSALAQAYTDSEILVVDDGSTDDTKSIVDRYGQKVRYLYQNNKGVSSARNLALSKATGEFIAYLDADDAWYPQKLERQVAFLDANKECGFVHSEISVINEQDEVTHVRFNRETQRQVPQGYCLLDLIKQSHIQTLTVLERRKCIDRIGVFDERLRTHEDYIRWIQIAMAGWAIGYLAEPLAMYRWREGSLMANEIRLNEDLERIFEILLSEKSLASCHGEDAATFVRTRLYDVRRHLAYLHRIEGRRYDSRRRILRLIQERPSRAELYIELIKAYIPPAIAAKFRTFRKKVEQDQHSDV